MFGMTPWLRAILALGLVGLVCMFFAFQAIGDGHTSSAIESGLAGVVLIALSAFVAHRKILRQPVKRRRRVSELLE